MDKTNEITPQQALGGSAAQFAQFFDQLHRNHFSHVPFGGILDYSLMATPQGQAELEEKMRDLYKRFPVPDPNISPEKTPDLIRDSVDSLNSIVLGMALGNAFFSYLDPHVFKMFTALAVDMRGNPLPATQVIALGASVCTHCLTPEEKVVRDAGCGTVDPDEARRSELLRMSATLHEFAHAMKSDGNGPEETVTVQRDGQAVKLDRTNYRESVADGFMTLMMMKYYGDEGKQTALAWKNDRHDKFLMSSHYTSATIASLLTLTEKDPSVLKLTPDKLLDLAIQQASQNALTPEEKASLGEFKIAKLTGKDVQDDKDLPPHIREYMESKRKVEQNYNALMTGLVDLNPLRKDPNFLTEAAAAEQQCVRLKQQPQSPIQAFKPGP